MIQFTPVGRENISRLAHYYSRCTYRISDYSAGIKLMWKNASYEYAEVCGCLLVRSRWNGQYYFDYPVPDKGENGELCGDVAAALEACGQYCAEHFIPFRLCNIPDCAVNKLLSYYPDFEIRTERNLDDYLYLAQDIIRFEGKNMPDREITSANFMHCIRKRNLSGLRPVTFRASVHSGKISATETLPRGRKQS